MIQATLPAQAACAEAFSDPPAAALFPEEQARWLGFADADITINAADGTFRAELLVPGPVTGGIRLVGFVGRWLASGGLILTAVTGLV